MNRRSVLAVLVAFLALVAGMLATPAQAAAPAPAAVSHASPALATGTLADYTCGHITQTSWGAGQVCYLIDSHHGQTIWKFAVLDKITDGYCVDGRRLTPDKSMYTITSPRVRSCTTGGWSTGFLATVNLEFGVRVFRSNSTDGGISFKVDMPPPY